MTTVTTRETKSSKIMGNEWQKKQMTLFHPSTMVAAAITTTNKIFFQRRKWRQCIASPYLSVHAVVYFNQRNININKHRNVSIINISP
jgi:hypothetical protein